MRAVAVAAGGGAGEQLGPLLLELRVLLALQRVEHAQLRRRGAGHGEVSPTGASAPGAGRSAVRGSSLALGAEVMGRSRARPRLLGRLLLQRLDRALYPRPLAPPALLLALEQLRARRRRGHTEAAEPRALGRRLRTARAVRRHAHQLISLLLRRRRGRADEPRVQNMELATAGERAAAAAAVVEGSARSGAR